MLLYHFQSLLKSLSALSVNVIYPQLDVFCASEEQLTLDIYIVHMIGMAGEVKVDDAKEDAENECFYNMFGQGIT